MARGDEEDREEFRVGIVLTAKISYMFCSHCGKAVKESAEFCEHCGKPIKPGVGARKEPASEMTATSKPKSSVVGLLVMLVILFLVVSWLANVILDQNPELAETYGNSITLYPVGCAGVGLTDFANCREPKALYRQTYTSDVKNQRVVESTPDGPNFHVLTGCTVLDEHIWKCEDGASMVGSRSRNGQQFLATGLSGIIFVTESQWRSINNGAVSPGQSIL